jgi:hypothetical protein
MNKVVTINDALAISWQDHVNFQWDDDDEVHFVLDQHA